MQTNLQGTEIPQEQPNQNEIETLQDGLRHATEMVWENKNWIQVERDRQRGQNQATNTNAVMQFNTLL